MHYGNLQILNKSLQERKQYAKIIKKGGYNHVVWKQIEARPG